MMFRREDILALMQKSIRILENFTTELASATYMLQQRVELLSYNGIAQKAAFWLLMQAKQNGEDSVRIPESISKWAMLMNVSRPSLHRELKKMEDEGMINYSPAVIRIVNQDALQAILGK
jgi:CRP-like cAMP-binding protein